MQWEVWQLWLAAAMALVILEIFVPGFVLACLGVGALAASIASAVGAGLTVQLVSAAAMSLVAFLFLRPIALRLAYSDEAVSGVEALVGRECVVTVPFDGKTGLGRCKVDGDDWRAELSNRSEAELAQENAAVWIERVESNTLVVTTQKPNS
jgi:membrane protein implicated in regulation of membrane protease activity